MAALAWLLFAMALLGGIGLWSPRYHRHPTIEAMLQGDAEAIGRGIGFLLGANFIGIVAALAALAARRRALAGMCVVTMLVTTTAVLRPTGDAPGLRATSAQAQRAARDMAGVFDRVLPKPGELPSAQRGPVASADAHGELSHMVRLAQEFAGGLAADRNEYEVACVALRLESVLLPMRLDSAAEIEDSRAKIATAQRLLREYRDGVSARAQAARATLASASLPKNVRDQSLRDFNEGLAASLPQMEQMFLYEAEVYAETGVLLDFMLERQGAFRVVRDQVLFDDPADAVVYNASIGRIQGIASKQTTLAEQMEERARAIAEWYRAVGEGRGSFDGEPPVQAPARGAPVRIELASEGPRINGATLSLPLTVAELSGALGQPSRTVEDARTVRVWDDAGVFALSEPGSEHILFVAVAMNEQSGYDFAPSGVCAGPVVLASAEVRDIDSPHSLNRRLEGVALECLDEWGTEWAVRFPAYSVGMLVDEYGLPDLVTIEAPAPPVERRAGAQPGF